MPDPSALFMKFFVELITEAVRRRRLKTGEFAALVWPDMLLKSAQQRWQYMRKGIPGKNRPMHVTLAEAYKMALAIGQEPVGLFLRANDRVIQAQEEAEYGNTSRGTKKARGSSLKSDN